MCYQVQLGFRKKYRYCWRVKSVLSTSLLQVEIYQASGCFSGEEVWHSQALLTFSRHVKINFAFLQQIHPSIDPYLRLRFARLRGLQQ